MPEVWMVDVEIERGRLDRHAAVLARSEIERASRFRRAEDRARFVVARGTLRGLLAARLDCTPQSIDFDNGPLGKPTLSNRPPGAPQFNSSHSGKWVLHAIDDLPVGVDVEEISPGVAILKDLSWVLSPEEWRLVSEVPASDRAAALTRAWVRKEAYVKALGDGLGDLLPDISIDEDPEGVPVLARDGNRPDELGRWSILDLDIDPRYKACLVHFRSAGPTAMREYRAPCFGVYPG